MSHIEAMKFRDFIFEAEKKIHGARNNRVERGRLTQQYHEAIGQWMTPPRKAEKASNTIGGITGDAKLKKRKVERERTNSSRADYTFACQDVRILDGIMTEEGQRIAEEANVERDEAINFEDHPVVHREANNERNNDSEHEDEPLDREEQLAARFFELKAMRRRMYMLAIAEKGENHDAKCDELYLQLVFENENGITIDGVVLGQRKLISNGLSIEYRNGRVNIYGKPTRNTSIHARMMPAEMRMFLNEKFIDFNERYRLSAEGLMIRATQLYQLPPPIDHEMEIFGAILGDVRIRFKGNQYVLKRVANGIVVEPYMLNEERAEVEQLN